MMQFDGDNDSKRESQNDGLPVMRETEIRDTAIDEKLLISNVAGADVSFLVDRIEDFTTTALKFFSD